MTLTDRWRGGDGGHLSNQKTFMEMHLDKSMESESKTIIPILKTWFRFSQFTFRARRRFRFGPLSLSEDFFFFGKSINDDAFISSKAARDDMRRQKIDDSVCGIVDLIKLPMWWHKLTQSQMNSTIICAIFTFLNDSTVRLPFKATKNQKKEKETQKINNNNKQIALLLLLNYDTRLCMANHDYMHRHKHRPILILWCRLISAFMCV